MGDPDALYRPFHIRKASSTKWRHIDNPTGEIRRVQEAIASRILTSLTFPKTMIGSIKGMSILDNAAAHLNADVLVKMDIRDCYPSISDRMVFDAFKDVLGCSDQIARILTRLTTYRHHLPQGAPTSSCIANMVLRPLHDRLQTLRAPAGVACTFFVDDIVLSGAQAPALMKPLISLVKEHCFSLQQNKILVLRGRREALTVTGLTINRGISIGRSRQAGLRQRVLAASFADVSSAEVKRIRGEIAWARSVSPQQGRALEVVAQKRLPGSGSAQPPVPKHERRPCDCSLGGR